MRLFGSRHDLDRRLREERPRPSNELVHRIEAGLHSARPSRHRRGRLGLVLAMTMILALGLTLTGSMSYATSAIKAGPSALKQLVVPSNNQGGGNEKVQICHVPPGNPANAHTIEVSSNAVPAHQAHGDPPGPCAAGPGSDQYREKVLICHRPPGNPANAHTLSVGPSAVPAHLAHGDSLGPCP